MSLCHSASKFLGGMVDTMGVQMGPENRSNKKEVGKKKKRRFVRYAVDLEVRLDENGSLPCRIREISENGFCLTCQEKIPVGREIGIRIILSPKPINARCKVIWRGPADSVMHHGGRFLGFDEDGHRILKRFLSRL